MNIREWVTTATNDASGREIALRIKEPVSTVNRQLAKDRPDPELIVAIAREYGASVLDALLAHGLIEQDDLAARVVVATLADADEKDLVAEIYRRVVKNEARKDEEHETPAPVVNIYCGRSPEESPARPTNRTPSKNPSTPTQGTHDATPHKDSLPRRNGTTPHGVRDPANDGSRRGRRTNHAG